MNMLQVGRFGWMDCHHVGREVFAVAKYTCVEIFRAIYIQGKSGNCFDFGAG
jgi:hypothetical protein